jgi:hypothetical protein
LQRAGAAPLTRCWRSRGRPPLPDGRLISVHDLEDGLAGGYDVIYGEEDGVKFFHVADEAGRQPLPSVAIRVAAEAAATADRLLASEREVIERFLLGSGPSCNSRPASRLQIFAWLCPRSLA